MATISFEKMNRNVQELCQDILQSLEEKVLVHAAVLLRKRAFLRADQILARWGLNNRHRRTAQVAKLHLGTVFENQKKSLIQH